MKFDTGFNSEARWVMTSDMTLPERIARQLRRDILLGHLAPGASVKERDKSTEMGVSRTPMREAIRILAKEGLIELRPSRSPLVANPTLQEITDSIQVLSALEVLACELACAQASDAQIEAVVVLHERFVNAYGSVDPLEAFEMDMDFHIAVVAGSNNAALVETHGAYLARLWRARYLSAVRKNSRERVLDQHTQITESLKIRDVGNVTKTVKSHLEHLVINVRDRFHADAQAIQARHEAHDATQTVGNGPAPEETHS
jgi:DNA-binding GntR family transcriptional regulator